MTTKRRLLIGALAAALVLAACGGGSNKSKTAATNPGGVTTTPEESTSSTTATGDTGTTTATTTAGKGGTSTTAKHTTKTTAKKSSLTSAVGNKSLTGGITNVTAPPATAPSKDVQPGGTITYLKVADVAGYDPILFANSGNSDGGVAFMLFDMLAYSDPKDGQVKPQTAESLTSTDAVTWTLKLRPNIKFTDGTDYDAAAVKFNWERLQNPANSATRAAQANLIQSMDVVDARTLKITLKAKNAVFPQAVALIPFIGSPTAINAKGANFRSDPVGAGPFTLKSWTRDSQAVFQRNPKYWNAP